MSCTLPTLLLGVALFATHGDPEPETFKMKFSKVKKWELILPQESWTTISTEIQIPNGEELGFPVEADPFKLHIDTDGNGRSDETIKGVGGEALLKGRHSDGTRFEYAVRIRKAGDGWQYACGSVRSGKVKGVKVSLIDQNGNAASYLSKVVNLKGQLYDFSADAQGTSVTVQPYLGEAGSLNVVSGYVSKGKLTSAVFSSPDGDLSFDLSGAGKGMLLPAGEYVLSSATAAKKVESVRMRSGDMRPVFLKEGDRQELAWGGPIRIDFLPGGKSPTILVKDKNGKELWSGKFCEG